MSMIDMFEAFFDYLHNKPARPVVNKKPILKAGETVKLQYNKLELEYIPDEEGHLWVTCEQLGKALDYADPRGAIHNIIKRHRAELDNYTTSVKLPVPGHGYQTVTIIHEAGVHYICMKTKQPKGDDFILWKANAMKEYFDNIQPAQPGQQLQQVNVNIDAEFIKLMGAVRPKEYLDKVLKDRATRISIV